MDRSLTDLLLSTRIDHYALADLRLVDKGELAIRCGLRSCAHLVLSGGCTLTLDSGEAVSLEAGDYALVTHGSLHHLRRGTLVHHFTTDLRALPLADHVPICRHGEGPSKVRLLTAVFGMERVRVQPDDSILPPLLVMRGATDRLTLSGDGEPDRLDRLLSGGGGRAMGASLLHMLFVQTFIEAMNRSYPHGWDVRQLSPVSAAIRIAARRLDEPWSVERLARSVGMSRSVFSALFTATTGESPGHYLGRLRLVEAEQMLRLTELPVSEIARQCGYRSQAAFTRAFRKRYEDSPDRFRNSVREPSERMPVTWTGS